jgi:hypothetical protein
MVMVCLATGCAEGPTSGAEQLAAPQALLTWHRNREASILLPAKQ